MYKFISFLKMRKDGYEILMSTRKLKKKPKKSNVIKINNKKDFQEAMKNVRTITDLENIDIDGDLILGSAILQPFANMTNSNRGNMWTSHFPQIPVLKEAEIPLVSTRYENQVGKYSSGYKEADKDGTVVAKFVRNKYNTILVVQNDDETFGIYRFKECHNKTESYGYKFNNYGAELDIEDRVEEGDILYANTSYDEYMNFMYGRNLRAVFFANRDMTHEDPSLITRSAAEKFLAYGVSELYINVNTNDILLNLYGDDKEYKCFPDIGEDIKNQQLCIRRRIDYANSLIDLRDLTKFKNGDVTYFRNGKVVDIQIYCNNDIEKLRKFPYRNQIVKYIDEDMAFCEEVVDTLHDLVEGEDNYLCTDELIQFYNDCKMKLDKNVYYMLENTRFDELVIKFTILEEKHVVKGSKMTGRVGNKGICGDIIEDDEIEKSLNNLFDTDMKYRVVPDSLMPIVESGPFKGLQAEICLNPLGVNNRKNYSQLFEVEINFIGLYIRYFIHEAKTLEEKEELLLEFYEQLGLHEQLEETKEFLDRVDDEEKEEFFYDYVERGIPVNEKPFSNMDIFRLSNIYAYYEEKGTPIEKFKFKDIDNPMVMGEMYIVKLKHEPKNKSNMRSTYFNSITSIPSKDREYKRMESLYPRSAVKLGEQEVIALLNCVNYRAVKELKDCYGINRECEEMLERKLLTENPFDITFEVPRTKSKPMEVNDELFYSVGIEFYDDENTVENPIDIVSEKRKELMKEECKKKKSTSKKRSKKKN